MELLTFLLGLGVGTAIWYGVFYFRYEDTKSVDWLRGNLGQTIDENLRLSWETKELTEQNLILKEKVTELLIKNNDLSSIVWELNRYYYYLKEWYTKASELVNMLKWVDPVMEEKIKKIVSNMEWSSTSNTWKNTGSTNISISNKPSWITDSKKKW